MVAAATAGPAKGKAAVGGAGPGAVEVYCAIVPSSFAAEGGAILIGRRLFSSD